MFLLNLIDADFLHKIQKFIIQNVPIKSFQSLKRSHTSPSFTIQNVPIKLDSKLSQSETTDIYNTKCSY